MSRVKVMSAGKNKFNWKFVGIWLAIIVILYFIASFVIEKNKQPQKETMYCYFNVSLEDSIPRDECGILKIVSRDISQIGIDKFNQFGQCSKMLDELQKCEGEVYHFSKYDLKEFCSEPDCNVDGIICSAFFIKYHNESEYRKVYEESFTEPNIVSKDILMKRIDRCK